MSLAAVSFTGGKDCVLALHAVQAATRPAGFCTAPPKDLDVILLVTFAPSANADFKAHPMAVIQAQAAALGLPHVVCMVDAPYLESDQHNIRRLRELHGIDALVTGDILDVCSGFMSRATLGTGAGPPAAGPVGVHHRAAATLPQSVRLIFFCCFPAALLCWRDPPRER